MVDWLQRRKRVWRSTIPMLALAVGVQFAAGGREAMAQNLTFETGIERLSSPQTLIKGLHRIYVGHNFTPNLSFGQSFYSAGLGDAGGAFFWGFEGVARLPLSNGFSISASGFAGGGGGAAQVIGDGTMLRAGLALDYQISQAWAVQVTGAWVRIDGAPIDGPAFGIGLRRQIGDQAQGAWVPRLDSAGVVATALVSPSGVRNRSGTQQQRVALVGARALFDLGATTQLSLAAAGAASGAQGYMQVMAGMRRNFEMSRATAFVEGAAGFGGGGDVDTGAGPLVEASAGLRMPVTRRMDAELSFGGIVAPTGSFRAATVSLGVMRNFGRTRSTDETPQRWAYSGGISVQRTGPGYFIGNTNTARHVVMQESSVDYFLGRNLYVTGNAQTTLKGGTAGYAVGLLGLGYEIGLGQRWAVSLEAHVGAAGGGGVNTAGGIVGGLRAELDYKVSENWALSFGLGHLGTLRGKGMSSQVASLGIKIPFSTH